MHTPCIGLPMLGIKLFLTRETRQRTKRRCHQSASAAVAAAAIDDVVVQRRLVDDP